MLERSCIVCSKKRNKLDLIRLVVLGGELVFDMSQKMGTRGYYICYDMNCINKVETQKKRIKEQFIFEKNQNLDRLKSYFIIYLLKMIKISYLNNNIIIGVNEILLNNKKLKYVIISSDISKSSLEKLNKFNTYTILDYLNIKRLELGEIVNKSYVVALGIKKIKDLNFKRVLSQYNILFSQE